MLQSSIDEIVQMIINKYNIPTLSCCCIVCRYDQIIIILHKGSQISKTHHPV